MSLEQPITVDDIEMAFNMLLDRSAGSEGLKHYEEHAVNRGWTRRQLREAITGSTEYCNRVRRKEQQMFYEDFTFFVDPSEPDFGRAISDVNYRYEAHNLKLLREILRPGDTYVDVGANIGVLSLTARTVVGERGRVICFEPMANNAGASCKVNNSQRLQ